MDICHLKNSELEPQFQKYKGRVVLRGDMVQDDSGSYAILTEQGSSAGQAADAVSAYTQVKLVDAPSLLKILKSECPDIWIQNYKWPKFGPVWKTQSFLSSEKSVRSSSGRTLVGKAIRESSIETRWVKSSKLGNFCLCMCTKKKTSWEETKH